MALIDNVLKRFLVAVIVPIVVFVVMLLFVLFSALVVLAVVLAGCIYIPLSPLLMLLASQEVVDDLLKPMYGSKRCERGDC